MLLATICGREFFFIRFDVLHTNNTNCNFYSDLDFSLKPSSDKPVLFENAIILCKRVSERADEIHQLILEMITDV